MKSTSSPDATPNPVAGGADGAITETHAAKDAAQTTSLKVERPLPGTAQHVVETLAPRFGHSFSDVKIHTGEEGDARTATLGAPAMAVGKSIYLLIPAPQN
jgi:hypothetical protein